MIPPNAIRAIALAARLHPAYRVFLDLPAHVALVLVAMFASEPITNDDIVQIDAFRHALGDA